MSTAPISLYFDIPKNEYADLEVVAKTAVEWVELIRDLASVIAPGVEVQVELVQTQDGSLWLSNFLKAAKEGDRKALAAIAYGVLAFFAAGPALHLQSDAGDKFWEMLGHEHKVELTDDDKKDIAERVVKALHTTDAENRRRNVIGEAEKDETIRGLGVGLRPKISGPICRIDRAEFPAYSELPKAHEPPPLKDVEIRSNVHATIVRANLEPGDTKPLWRFREGDEKWSADIEDDGFIYALNHESTGIPLAVGQTMVMTIAIDRVKTEGIWKIKKRRVLRVVEPRVARHQGSLGLGGE
ncbi:hypothetical protein [Novosphingopyxis iocasae]|uniref:hypothetical protein n=1 Tax=Novosphingopyxis iocasae TaxID=2762729 RepID=UPI001650D5B0|nr:hypothetical protein [Novosphingopyxis iocasae]